MCARKVRADSKVVSVQAHLERSCLFRWPFSQGHQPITEERKYIKWMRGGKDFGLPQLCPPSSLHLLTPTLYSALWLQDGALADTHTEPATFI